MSQLSTKQYLSVHRQLRKYWLTDNSPYGNLSPTDQWLLHSYFQPYNDLSREQLLAHKADISRRRPTLPAEALNAWAVFQVRRKTKQPVSRRTPKHRPGNFDVLIYSIVNPEPDPQAMAALFLRLAKYGHRDDSAA